MRRYTYYGNTQLEELIDGHLKLITTKVNELLGGKILSIILTGGYGRGEGAVYYLDGQETVFNDYDLFIISDKIPWYEIKKYRKLLVTVAKELTGLIGIEVDLFLMSKRAFKKLPFTLMNYEMKKKSIIIFGDQNILDLLPNYDDNIPAIEGTRLLLNRGILLLYCKRYFFKKNNADEEQRKITIKYIIKAILAMGDSYLLAIDQYDYSYVKKTNVFREITTSDYQLFEELVDYYLIAADFKLKVEYAMYIKTNISIWLFHIISLYETYLYWYEEKRLGVEIASWEEYKELIIKSAKSLPCKTKIKNFLINIRDFGILKTLKDYELMCSYPRDRLYILITFALFRYDPEVYKHADIIANKQIEDLDSLVDRFWEIWLKYS